MDFRCQVCSKSFPSTSNLERHFLTKVHRTKKAQRNTQVAPKLEVWTTARATSQPSGSFPGLKSALEELIRGKLYLEALERFICETGAGFTGQAPAPSHVVTDEESLKFFEGVEVPPGLPYDLQVTFTRLLLLLDASHLVADLMQTIMDTPPRPSVLGLVDTLMGLRQHLTATTFLLPLFEAPFFRMSTPVWQAQVWMRKANCLDARGRGEEAVIAYLEALRLSGAGLDHPFTRDLVNKEARQRLSKHLNLSSLVGPGSAVSLTDLPDLPDLPESERQFLPFPLLLVRFGCDERGGAQRWRGTNDWDQQALHVLLRTGRARFGAHTFRALLRMHPPKPSKSNLSPILRNSGLVAALQNSLEVAMESRLFLQEVEAGSKVDLQQLFHQAAAMNDYPVRVQGVHAVYKLVHDWIRFSQRCQELAMKPVACISALKEVVPILHREGLQLNIRNLVEVEYLEILRDLLKHQAGEEVEYREEGAFFVLVPLGLPASVVQRLPSYLSSPLQNLILRHQARLTFRPWELLNRAEVGRLLSSQSISPHSISFYLRSLERDSERLLACPHCGSSSADRLSHPSSQSHEGWCTRPVVNCAK